MLAISRDDNRMFIFEPNDGLRVPVMVNLDRRTLEIASPTVQELEDDYYLVDDVHSLGKEWRAGLQRGIEVSAKYTSLLGDKINHVTVRELADMIDETL